jgi:hypothetical protein
LFREDTQRWIGVHHCKQQSNTTTPFFDCLVPASYFKCRRPSSQDKFSEVYNYL